MTQEELKIALELHEKWLSNKSDGVRLDFQGEDLSGMDLSYVNLNGSDFSSTDLSYANFHSSDLSGVDFSWAKLSGVDFSLAKLSGTDFSWANFNDVDFSLANLSGADLSWAKFSGVDFSLANTINVIGLDVICVQLNTSNQNRQIQYYVQLRKVTAGRFSGTLDELKKAVREKHDISSVIYKRYQIAFKTIEDILETY